MSCRVVYNCDSCGNPFEDEARITIHAVVGEQKDMNTCRTENITAPLDLCPKCATQVLQAYVEKLNSDDQKKWRDRVGKMLSRR